ncbi:MAG: transposase family protein [Deltaproteobacteria bacterium]|nr:transposase family protein [Deltaproteobacteria bacterium]
MIHSDQGSQFISKAWKTFCKNHNLVLSISRIGNCLDNAVIESFYSFLKKEIIKGQFITALTFERDIFNLKLPFAPCKKKRFYIKKMPIKNLITYVYNKKKF